MNPILSTPSAILIALATASVSAYFAHRRGSNPYLWFGVGFLFGALGIIALFLLPFPSKKKAKTTPSIVPAPLPTILGPSNKFWYYLDATHQQNGPMSLDALTSMWKEEKISLHTFVWHEDLSDWKRLEEFIQTPPQKS